MLVGLIFLCLFGFVVPLAVNYALECPCVPVAKKNTKKHAMYVNMYQYA